MLHLKSGLTKQYPATVLYMSGLISSIEACILSNSLEIFTCPRVSGEKILGWIVAFNGNALQPSKYGVIQ